MADAWPDYVMPDYRMTVRFEHFFNSLRWGLREGIYVWVQLLDKYPIGGGMEDAMLHVFDPLEAHTNPAAVRRLFVWIVTLPWK